ncbi:MAG: hypothetical protein ACTSRP_07375 [Candidatus Helarchaeota archaeon]
MTIEDYFLIMTIIITVLITFFEIIYSKLGKTIGWYLLREAIIRILIPLVVSILWICYTSFYPWSFLVFISFIVSFFIFLILYYTEYYLGVIVGLDCLGRFTLFFHRFMKRPEVLIDVKLYYAKEFNVELEEIFEMIERQIKRNKELKGEKLSKLKKSIEILKKNYENAKIRYYFYLDTREISYGYRCLIVVSDREDLPSLKKLEGAVLDGGKGEFFDKKMKILILFEGSPRMDLLQKLETDHDIIVSIYNQAGDIKLLETLMIKLQQSERRVEELKKLFHDEVAKEALLNKMLGIDIKKEAVKTASIFLKYMIILGIIVAMPSILIIILLVFGII